MSRPVDQVKRSQANRADVVSIEVYDEDGTPCGVLHIRLHTGLSIFIGTEEERLVGPIRIDKFGNCWT